MSEGPLARQVVDSLPRPYFEFLVTGDTVSRGKPHPEAYLTAVERLRETDPHLHLGHCVALEDSAPGVAAAVASGVATVAIPHIVPLPEHSHYTLWDTLAGRSRTDLEELLATADKASTAAGLAANVGTTP
jgi:beta-phosphoglucomutase-like phosphatase (HAD superfamily)